MLKSISIIAALVALGIGPAGAQEQRQEQQAVLQKIELPNAGFDIVLATATPGAASIELRHQPNPHVLYLMGAELVQPYTGEVQRVFAGAGAMTVPACAFQTAGRDGGRQTPVAVYVVPKGETPLASAQR